VKAAAVEDSSGLGASDLVATKLAASSVRDGYVPRPRLIGALEAGRDARLTLVDAPTGYGKTMLLAAWCARLTSRGEHAIAWVSLAPTENDPALFMRYLLDALRRAGAEVSERTEALVRVPGGSPVAWMRSLVNDLAGVKATTTLVLDDYHLVKEPACRELVQLLLDHAPESLHLVISTRTDPPIALGSLRARGELTEIRADQLRFTPREAAELLVGREGLQLDSDAVANLAARTEGWGAGLYLAALCYAAAAPRSTTPYDSPARTGTSSTISAKRCSSNSTASCGSSCSAPPSPIGCAPPCARRSPTGRRPGCSRRSSARTCSSSRSMTPGPGTATTICSARCSAASSRAAIPRW
jgi:hypothetical protein